MNDAPTFTVVLEDIRAQFGVFGEALQGLKEHMETRFDAVDRRFDAVDRRFDAVDRRFDAVDRRFEQTEQELGLVKTAVLETSRELKQSRQAAALTAGVLDEKVDRAEVAALVERAVQKQR